MRNKHIFRLLWLVPGSVMLASPGCDAAADIVFASLNLAAAIVDAAS